MSTNGTSTKAVLTGLTPLTTYTFVVTAYNDVGLGSQSPESRAIVTKPGVPARVIKPTAHNIVSVSLILMWGAPAEYGRKIIGYKITIQKGIYERSDLSIYIARAMRNLQLTSTNCYI